MLSPYIRDAAMCPLLSDNKWKQSLLEEGVISSVTHSEWATPIVPVMKKDGTVRLCGDFKVTLNPSLAHDTYPMPTINDLQEKLNGGVLFSKLDLSRAYSQVPLDDQSKQYTTITTHKGLYSYNRLPFGITPAAAIFQRAMDQILQGLPGILCYQDDILVTGSDRRDHMTNLEAVLQRLQTHGLTVRREKCVFMQNSLKYLGHMIDKEGIHPTSDKVEAIRAAPQPEDTSQLRSFLGMINYYKKFLPNLSNVLHPLHDLLKKDIKWEWSKSCKKAFDQVKRMISTDRVLIPYKPIVTRHHTAWVPFSLIALPSWLCLF